MRQGSQVRRVGMMRLGLRGLLLGAVLAAALAVPGAQAAYTITIQQVGNDVVAMGSGSLDVTPFGGGSSDSRFPNVGTTNGFSFVFVGGSALGSGSAVTVYSDEFNPVTGGDAVFGVVGEGGFASSATGDLVGLEPASLFDPDSNTKLYVPEGYVAGAPLSGTATWADSTINSLGLFAGSYVWAWDDGASADSLTLVIVAPGGPEQVPEPGTLVLMAAGLASLGLARRQRG